MRSCSVFALISGLLVAGGQLAAKDGGARLAGQVSASGAPLSDCVVSAYRLDAAQTKYLDTTVTRTDAGGRYGFKELVPGSYIVIIKCGADRVFQGAVFTQMGDNRKDVLLEAVTATAQLQLSQIVVEDDGSNGTTGWIFDVYADGRKVLSMPDTKYNDDKGKNIVRFGSRMSASVLLPANRTVKIEVQGRRSAGGDRAVGSSLATPGQAVDVAVRNPNRSKDGSFVFSFTVGAPTPSAPRPAPRG